MQSSAPDYNATKTIATATPQINGLGFAAHKNWILFQGSNDRCRSQIDIFFQFLTSLTPPCSMVLTKTLKMFRRWTTSISSLFFLKKYLFYISFVGNEVTLTSLLFLFSF